MHSNNKLNLLRFSKSQKSLPRFPSPLLSPLKATARPVSEAGQIRHAFGILSQLFRAPAPAAAVAGREARTLGAREGLRRDRGTEQDNLIIRGTPLPRPACVVQTL
jgi:hypothetical protein